MDSNWHKPRNVLVMTKKTNIPSFEEKLLYTNDAILEAIFGNADFLIAYLDRDLNFVKVSNAYANIFGFSPDFFVGKNYFQLIPHQKFQDVFQTVIETGKPYHEFAETFQYIENYDSKPLYWDWSLIPVKDARNEVTTLILTLVDVTDRKNAEDKASGYISELERSNQELEEFAYVASHDLQEPLRKIQIFGGLLRKQLTDMLSSDAADYLDRMVTAAARMRTLIDSLLSYSRITTKGKPFQTVDMGAVTREAVSNLEALIEQKHARVEIGELPVIEADVQQMVQLVQNLVLNSLKFQNKENIPHVKIWSPAERTSKVNEPNESDQLELCEIRVQDNGIGFQEKHLDRIFIAFQRLHGRSEYQGVGIGLAICRKIIDRHQGYITAKSTPGKGSTFIVRLPISHSDKSSS
jgi:PAS domain S-box-containing protein